jgi:hypothetical protein
MATASVTLEGTGTLSTTETMSANSITIGDRALALNVYLSDTADGTFSIGTSTDAVTLPNSTWVEVYRRESTDNTGDKIVYFATGSGRGTQSIFYRVTA